MTITEIALIFILLFVFIRNHGRLIPLENGDKLVASPDQLAVLVDLLRHPPYAILDSLRKAGMFSELDDVLALFIAYEKGLFAGAEVDFGKTSLYHDPNHGPNWWKYYFEPVAVGAPLHRVMSVAQPLFNVVNIHVEGVISRPQAHQLIQKYFHIRPGLTAKVEAFVEKNFQGQFVIGIHYRGTDKFVEAPRISYDQAAKKVDEMISRHHCENYKIFVATDEGLFLNFMMTRYPDHILYADDIIRSMDDMPVHYNKSLSPYQLGENALVDALLLSRTNFLIRTSSNLSRWSTYFNPSLPVIELTQRH